MAAGGPIVAGGGVVWRGQHGALDVALVHRGRYDDWSLPKGKVQGTEGELAAAVREVREELGAVVSVSRRIGKVRYVVDNLPKTVAYWAMRYQDGTFSPNDEVDDVDWLAPAKARQRLTYEADRGILADFTALPAPESVVILVRHARAGKRRDWSGPDELRPLEPDGQAQAQRLATLLSCFTPDRIIAAEPLRCIQTVEPLAHMLGLAVEVDPVFDDESYLEARTPTHAATKELLAQSGRTTVVCSQGVTIPALVERLGAGVSHSDTRKGAAWVLSAVGGDIIAADYYEAAGGR